MSFTETELRELLAIGEGPSIEFKRQLNLATPSDKAEFVKDVVALANSANPVSYLVVGVQDDGVIVGAPTLERERIQQIIDTYIAPALPVSYIRIPVSSPSDMEVQVVHITGPQKPYYVSRDLERLLANEVLVRHGSVVVRPSPIEIAEMRDAVLGGRDAKRHLRRAELLFRDGKFEAAIDASTEAVAILPSAQGYLCRARSYVCLKRKADAESSELTYHKGLWWVEGNVTDPKERQAIMRKSEEIDRRRSQYDKAAQHDYLDAVTLAASTGSIDLEKEIRFERLKEWRDEDDYKWLEANTHGREAGRVLYYRTDDLANNDWLYQETTQEAETYLGNALELGFDTSSVYYLLAQVEYSKHNFGIAFEHIEVAIKKWENGDREDVDDTEELESFRAAILWRLGQYDQAFNYWEMRSLSDDSISPYADLMDMTIERDILCRLALVSTRNSYRRGLNTEALQIMQILRRHISEIKKEYPRCAEAIEKLLKSTA